MTGNEEKQTSKKSRATPQCPVVLRWVKQVDVARAWSYFAKKSMSASHYPQLEMKERILDEFG